ncbi:hypothetical protein PHYPO_G00161200 [Pangasianodon hypophthalmus]|uniref:Uncharacterized protein n=1 Tax=Pangasianodon hypophthalmus TaxID=310915 RepID=A0A5N5JY78_PANHP|nr:hypothetical protein PHYPO_G00161200 [Pangasianodon hypophthalmus]
MENISEVLVQNDSQRETMFETPASDSDSGDSLFLTQSVTSASRTVKRHRPSYIPACPFSQESEDELERDGDQNAQHEDTRTRSDSDSETNYANLHHRWKLLVKPHGRISRRSRPRCQRATPKRMVLPFLKKSRSGQLSARKNQIIVNSEIGGFFKCISKLSKGHGEKRRRELSPSILPSEWEENNVEENEEDDEDIRKVSTDCFILHTHKRNRRTWLPSLKWKTKQAPRKCTEKSNKCQEEQEKCHQPTEVAEDLMEPQDDTDIHNESSSFNIEVSQPRKKGEKSRKSPARSSLSPCSSPSHLSPDKSPFVRSLFMDHQEEHTENQPQVLVTCSQSQFVDWHQAQKINQACENLMEPIDEMAVEETQWPSLAEQDEDETQILEDNPTDRDRGKDALCLENNSFREHQEQDEDIREGVHHEPVENEDLSSVSGGFISSQDLFQEPNNQASPLKETSVENYKEVLESHVVLHDDVDSIIKKKKRKSSLILADAEGDDVKYSKSQRTQPTEIISATAGDISQERKVKDKKTLDDSVENAYPSLPLEDYTSGSIGNDCSSHSKEILMVRQEVKTETPLFNYGGLKFLKRKKGKNTEAPEISDNLAQIQADPGQNEVHIVKGKKRKKDNEGLLEEPLDTLPEISVSAGSSLSVQDTSVVCASVGGSKPKKKRKKDKHGQPVPQEGQWIGVEETVQISCQGSASLVSIAEETEQLTRTDLSSPSMSHEVSQLDSSRQVNKDLIQSDGLEPRRKKKKEAKKSPEEMVTPQCSEESHSSHGTKTVKKKKQKFIDDVGEMAMASKNLGEPLDKILEIPAGIEIQTMNSIDLKTDDSVTPRKKKKRKQREVVREENVDDEALLVETTQQAGTPDTVQDSEQQAVEVVLVRKVKKQKKKKDRTETHQEEEASKNASVSLRLGLCEMTTSNTPSTRSETGGIDEEEGLGGSEPVKKKKKKKKRKELENDGSWSFSHGLEYSHNTEQTTVVKEASSSGQKCGEENPAPYLEMQLTNDTSEKKKRERTKGDNSESSQEVLQSEDTIQPKGKKKKKKRWVETDIEVYPEIVEHDVCQESGSPSEPSEAVTEKKKKKKKKKNRKDTVDRGENESLDVVPELSAAEETRDVLVTCHTKEDSISSSGGELLVHIKKKKKKKQVRDSNNDLEATL